MPKIARDKIAYFLIAFSLYLILRGLSIAGAAPVAQVLLYLSIAVSLLASNVPRVLDLPLHYVHPVRIVELFTFGIALACFASLCLRRILA